MRMGPARRLRLAGPILIGVLVRVGRAMAVRTVGTVWAVLAAGTQAGRGVGLEGRGGERGGQGGAHTLADGLQGVEGAAGEGGASSSSTTTTS